MLYYALSCHVIVVKTDKIRSDQISVLRIKQNKTKQNKWITFTAVQNNNFHRTDTCNLKKDKARRGKASRMDSSG